MEEKTTPNLRPNRNCPASDSEDSSEKRRRRRRRRSEVWAGGLKCDMNVTPLVDVVLVLLIIFMVITPALQMGYDVVVPPKAPADALVDEKVLAEQVVVSVTAEGDLYINKEKVSQVSSFAPMLAEIIRLHRVKMVFFSCDEKYNYGEAMKVMDMIRGSSGGGGGDEGKAESSKIDVGIVLEPTAPTAPVPA